MPVELEIEINGLCIASSSKVSAANAPSARPACGSQGVRLRYSPLPYSPLVASCRPSTARPSSLLEDADGQRLSARMGRQTGTLPTGLPAGAWTHNGTYIDGVLNIANAVGATQPHLTADSLDPSCATRTCREWGTVTPDFELPVALSPAKDRGQTKPDYNRVFVSGINPWLALRQVTRFGTAGDLAAGLDQRPAGDRGSRHPPACPRRALETRDANIGKSPFASAKRNGDNHRQVRPLSDGSVSGRIGAQHPIDAGLPEVADHRGGDAGKEQLQPIHPPEEALSHGPA